VFDSPYNDVAEVLNIDEAACRQLVSRAKKSLGQKKVRSTISKKNTDLFLGAFKQAITHGDSSKLQTMLAKNIIVRADGGGKVAAILHDIVGIKDAVAFLSIDLKQPRVYY